MERMPDCLWPLEAVLGEGPLWRAADEALWFVDIKSHRVHRCGASGDRRGTWTAPGQVSFLAPMAEGRFLAGLEQGLALFDPADGAFRLVRELEPPSYGNRTNDATVDRAGRLWFGTMHDAAEVASGALYSLHRGRLLRHDDGYVVTNGPAVSPDGRTLYHVDTLAGRVLAFELRADGTLGPRRVFAHLEAHGALPDGVVVDSIGRVWVGLWGGWGAQAYRPDGTPDEFIRLPCANVTKVCFGGPGLATMFFTTARIGFEPEALAAQPLAGGVFACAASAPGLPLPMADPLAAPGPAGAAP